MENIKLKADAAAVQKEVQLARVKMNEDQLAKKRLVSVRAG